jgi:uncharacterized membrane protein (UPF0127 family)
MYVKVINRKTKAILIESAKWCNSRICRFIGFQFRRRLNPGDALVLVHEKDTINRSSIHMLFVFTSLTVIWINKQGFVTHTVIAKPWRLFYASPNPASFVLETSPDFIDQISIGDELEFLFDEE